MMTFERTTNAVLIKLILRHPAIWPHVGDDFAPSAEAFEPNLDSRLWYVTAHDADELLGLFLFVPQTTVCWESHVSMLPSAWGRRALQAGRDVIPWLFAHTTCRRLIGQISEGNPRAIWYAKAAGMVEYGRNPQAWLKDGILHDQVLVGISK
jgi:RimJ/RimL family protein N-acetyltransferase